MLLRSTTIIALCLFLAAPAAPPAGAAHDAIKSCKPFPLERGGPPFRSVRRSAHLSCAMARKLLKAAYGTGPLEAIRRTYPDRDSDGNPIGRPIYWMRGGWRCGTGAGGAACWNAKRPAYNAITDFGGVPKAVTAEL